jgi:hypothetical protein
VIGISKVRLVRDRHVVVEQMLVVLGAYLLRHGLLGASVSSDRRPRRIERTRIIHRVGYLKLLAVLDHLPAFHHMNLRAVWGEVIVDRQDSGATRTANATSGDTPAP